MRIGISVALVYLLVSIFILYLCLYAYATRNFGIHSFIYIYICTYANIYDHTCPYTTSIYIFLFVVVGVVFDIFVYTSPFILVLCWHLHVHLQLYSYSCLYFLSLPYLHLHLCVLYFCVRLCSYRFVCI